MALVKCKECGNQVSTEAKACPTCGAKPPRKTGLWTWVIAIFFGFVVFSIIGGGGGGSSTDGVTATTAAPPPDPRKVAMDAVKLTRFSWAKGGFDSVMLATFTVENTGERSVKDIEFTCVHSAKSGTVIDRNRKVVFDTVPAKGRKTFKEFNMGFIHSQADSSSCSITDLKLL